MKCPYCNKQAKVKDRVLYNLEAYGKSVKARTSCCGKLIRVTPIITFKAYEADQNGADDWGD